MKQTTYDITIVGSALVGATLACALQDLPFRILLIDAEAPSTSTDKRLIALTHTSCNLFKNLNIWPALSPHAAAINEIHVSNRGRFGSTRITAKEAALQTLGHVVPAHYINTALSQHVSAIKNLTILRPAKLTALQQNDAEVTLTIKTQDASETISSKIVIGADGTNSTVRELLGIQTDVIDYQQKALVTHTELQRDHHHIAYERFLPTGAIAMLPLTGRKVATIWSDSDTHVNALLALSDEQFLQELQTQFGYRLGKFIKTAERACYPLKFVTAKQQSSGRVVLIGNAAHTLHPVAAQGFNLSLYEIAVLKDMLSTQSPDTLILPDIEKFLRQQHVSLNLSHQLTRLFAADFFMLNSARQIGLLGFDICKSAKKHFIKRATASSGFVPELFLQE